MSSQNRGVGCWRGRLTALLGGTLPEDVSNTPTLVASLRSGIGTILHDVSNLTTKTVRHGTFQL